MARIRFTDKWIKNLSSPRTGRLEFVDAICPGLYLRIGRTGKKSFSVILRVDGRQLRHTIGRYPQWSLALAREEAMKLMRDADVGIDPRVEAKIATEAITFKEMVDAFIELETRKNRVFHGLVA